MDEDAISPMHDLTLLAAAIGADTWDRDDPIRYVILAHGEAERVARFCVGCEMRGLRMQLYGVEREQGTRMYSSRDGRAPEVVELLVRELATREAVTAVALRACSTGK